jgi:hypothetical protein
MPEKEKGATQLDETVLQDSREMNYGSKFGNMSWIARHVKTFMPTWKFLECSAIKFWL